MTKKVLNDRYEIIEKIGSGGMAEVYKAKDRVLRRNVAIKILKEEYVNDENIIKSFKQESMAVATLNHKNIVNIYDTGEDSNIYYIVMELVEGTTLDKMIKERKILEISEVVNISLQICEALEHAHNEKIVHRDIKPHNIIIKKNNIVKVADFGIAKAVTAKTMINNDFAMGSAHYLSPEQARGGYIDEKSDIYSLGIVMYEMATGKVPFTGENPVSVAIKHLNETAIPPEINNKNIPQELSGIIMKCINKKQIERYDSVSEIISDLKKTNISEKNNQESENQVRKEYGKNNATKKEREKNTKIILRQSIMGIASALIITSLLAFFALSLLKNFLTVPEVEVPSLVGKNIDDARKVMGDLNLPLIVKESIYNSEYDKNVVIKQNIKAGEKIKEKFTVEVIVSKGEKKTEVPDIIFKYSNEASVIIRENGLVEGEKTYEFNDTIPWGLVISQSPQAGEIAQEGAKINFVISKGPEIEYILMPQLAGIKLEEAKKILEENELLLGGVTYKDSELNEKDIVFYQSHPANSEIAKNTEINLLVSTGIQDETRNSQPQNSSEDTNESRENQDDEAENSDENDIKGSITVKLPLTGENNRLAIKKKTESGLKTVYEKEYEYYVEKVKVNVYGYGKTEFQIYVNEELFYTEEIDFGTN